MNPIDKLYQMMIDGDETLMGHQWEEMNCNEYDTPKRILENFIDIYLRTVFVELDDDLIGHPLDVQAEEKILALIRYLEKIINDLKDRINIPEKVEEFKKDYCGDTIYIQICPVCRSRLDSNKKQKYCHECGQKLEWKE